MEFNQKGRLFVFGCEVTKYKYPTWADIIGTTWAHYENWAQSEMGNEFIFNSVIECDVRNKFTSNDTVLIMWSELERIDWYCAGRWQSAHNKFSEADSELIPDMNGYKIKSFAYFQAINDILTNRNIPFSMMSWCKYESSYNQLLNIKQINFAQSKAKTLFGRGLTTVKANDMSKHLDIVKQHFPSIKIPNEIACKQPYKTSLGSIERF